jgi:hypothetical protein
MSIKDSFKEAWSWFKEWALVTLGHAASGFGAAAIYELTQLYSAGVYDLKVLITGALVGGSIGFLRKIIDAIEALSPKRTEAGTNQKRSMLKPARRYFGI